MRLVGPSLILDNDGLVLLDINSKNYFSYPRFRSCARGYGSLRMRGDLSIEEGHFPAEAKGASRLSEFVFRPVENLTERGGDYV